MINATFLALLLALATTTTANDSSKNKDSVAALAATPENTTFPRLRASCFQYAYETSLKLLSPVGKLSKNQTQQILQQAKLQAFNMAGDICRLEVQKECLEYTFARIQQEYGTDLDQETLRKIWGEAVNACRRDVDHACLKLSENFWQQTGKYRSSYEAFQNAVVSCDNKVKAICLEYAYGVEQSFRKTELVAFGNAVSICRDDTNGDCLQLLYEKIIPDVQPDFDDTWAAAVKVCRRK